MLWLRNILCGVAAASLAEFVPTVYSFTVGRYAQKATGLAVVAGAFVESLQSPLFWVLTILFFFLFRWASRSGSGAVRVLLFWVPGVVFSVIGIAYLAVVAYLFWHFRHG